MTQLNTITVRIRQVYGRDTVYPVCERALIFALLIGQKSFGPHDLAKIRSLGYTIETEQQTLAA